MLRSFVAVVLVVLIAPAAADAARQRLPATGRTPLLPELAGADVVYRAYPTSGESEIRAVGPGGDRVVRVVPAPPADDDDVSYDRAVRFEASSGALATLKHDTFSVKASVELDGYTFDYGPLAGPWTALHECGATIPAALDGNRIALTRCTGDQKKVEVRDVVAGTTLATFDNASAVDLAGDLVAFHRDGSVVVWNLASGAEIYRVATTRSVSVLQADGKIVVAPAYDAAGTYIGTDGCSSLQWYSPAEPTAHPLPGCASFSSVRIAADRVMYEIRDAAQGLPRLVVSDLAGQMRTVAGDVAGFDFDGIRAVYACNGKLYEDDLAEPLDPSLCVAHPQPEPGAEDERGCHPSDPTARVGDSRRCPVEVRGGRVPVDSNGRATLVVHCPVGCLGDVRLRRRVAGKWRWISKRARLNIATGRTARVRVKVAGGRPAPGSGYKVEAIAHSLNRTVRSRTYSNTLRLVRGG